MINKYVEDKPLMYSIVGDYTGTPVDFEIMECDMEQATKETLQLIEDRDIRRHKSLYNLRIQYTFERVVS